MSELRDLTNALRTFDKRIMKVEECLVILVRNSKQESEWRHEQKNRAQVDEGLRLQSEIAMKQVQNVCGAISDRLAEVVERLDNQAATRLSDVKELRERVRDLELKRPSNQEVTKA